MDSEEVGQRNIYHDLHIILNSFFIFIQVGPGCNDPNNKILVYNLFQIQKYIGL